MAHYSLEDYQYTLPKELIAHHPLEPRERAKLMLISRDTGSITHHTVNDLQEIFTPQDLLIFNNTKVIPARLQGTRMGGGKSECFLLKKITENRWEALVRPAKKLPPGKEILFSKDFKGKVLQDLGEGKKLLSFQTDGLSFEEALEKYGQIPLPPYIQREKEELKDKINYQTSFAEKAGAVAAPTASLHFTPSFLQKLRLKQIEWTLLTLHVGLGTFKPVHAEDIRTHPMHHESFELSQATANTLNQTAECKRHIAIGTTVCRVLESVSFPYGATAGETNLFLYPGATFRSTDALLTNFHLPGSTLLMLVAAFAGYALCMEAYHKAIENGYRFYSYGDAMLIV